MPSDPVTTLTRTTRWSALVSLFASLSTLLCCAFPSLLVLLGLDATVVSVLSALPWLVTVSRHKVWVFAIAGTLIAGDAYYLYRVVPRLLMREAACPPDAADACARASRFSRMVFLTSAGIYCVGLVTAVLLGPVLAMLEQ